MSMRWMIRGDMPAVLAIEQACFDDAWPEDEFLSRLRCRNVIGQVVEFDDTICGFVIYELNQTFLKILNIAVDPMMQGRGLGAEMVDKLTGKLNEKRSSVQVLVRERNLDAQLFFRSMGFLATSIDRQPFDNCDEDGIWMVYRVRVPA